ncbi:S-adenosyl-L-methionine-dependent methyltransferase [Aspergillus caelatus]|uniref:S-adenosyl-L-methionine-dependent methyltransferase n=1 Tax=Aspergillus caelatus TaxID=61420 RepID=A0A5N6ZYK6_9EURO|nr:S-adenosyl-L-methionine-dependent methyltransferase [Aspergillus caelatus]KAE8362373.1 S-adenosyl-L-methionine-dependent methyltransferase [Aspergillus caelatus]
MATHNDPESTEVTSTSPQLPLHEYVEADDVSSDAEGFSYEAECSSYTTSLSSSVFAYKFEHGRRYHAYRDENYYLPNDDEEKGRLDLFHHILTLSCNNKLHLAPISPDVEQILDLGTGTGIWAIDMGDLYPSTEVLGNDLSPIQPTMVPPNVRFEVDDVENDWDYRSEFDYIHARYFAGAIKDWPNLLRQTFKFTKPGGWVEFQDFEMQFYTTNGEFKTGCPLDKWCTESIEGLRSVGLEPSPGPKLQQWFKDAGFTNVQQKVVPVPVGVWPKDKRLKTVGALNYHQFNDGLDGMSLRIFTAMKGWQPEELREFLADVRKDLRNPRLQAQHNFYVVYGQKPE